MSDFHHTCLVLIVQLLLLIQSIQTWEHYDRKFQLKSFRGIKKGITQIINPSITSNTSIPLIKTITGNLHISSSNNTDWLIKLLETDDTTDSTGILTESIASTNETSITTTTEISVQPTTTTMTFQQNLPVQLSYTIATPESIALPPNVTSSAIDIESYSQIEKMINNSLSNIYNGINIIIYEAKIVQNSVQFIRKEISARSSSIYYLYVNTTLQLPFVCLSGSTCIDEIQTALEQTPLTALTLKTENGIFDISVEKPTVQGLKPSIVQANRIGLIVGIVLAVVSTLVLVGVASYVIVQKRKTLKLNKQFSGDFNLPIHRKYLKKNQHNYGNKVFSYELDASNSFHSSFVRLVKNWIGPRKSGFEIETIEIVENRDKFTHFRQQIEIVESRQKQSIFQPQIDEENNPEERQKVLNRLYSLYEQVEHDREVNIVRVWHGCDKTLLPQLLGEGFASLGLLDDGWFGKGMYFSSSAEYASRYCPKNENACLLMCYVLVLNPFPVIYHDAPKDAKPNKFRFYGRGNYRTYQCHYIPVAPLSERKSNVDFRPPPEGTDRAIYDELVVFDSANILPQIVVHLKTRGSRSSEIQPVPVSTDARTTNENKHDNQNHLSRYRYGFNTSSAKDQMEMNMIKVSVDERNNDDDDRR